MSNWTQNLTNSHAWLISGDVDIETIISHFEVSQVDYQHISESPIKIEVIRQLIHWINLRPINSPFRLVFVQNAESLTNESANALLKTLEEPPPYAKLFLLTKDEAKILATIKSRCQKLRLTSGQDETIPENYLNLKSLAKLSIKEKFDWSKQIAELEKADLQNIFRLWEIDLHQELLAGENVTKLIKEISLAKGLLETNISVKLLLENLLINLEEK